MPSEILLLCECNRRYAQTRMLCAETRHGVALCACGRTLGVWDGRYRLEFEPEMDEEDALPAALS